jgi:CRISPR-associated protein Csm1
MDKQLLFLYSLVKDSKLDNEKVILDRLTNDFDYTKFDTILEKAGSYVPAKKDSMNDLQLHTIFSKLGASEKSYPFAKLAIDEPNIFPIPTTEQDVSEHINLYKEAVNNILGIDSRTFADTLFAIQKQYLWCVLSNNAIDTPVISEYEFIKSRAAFAQCLASDNKDTKFPFLLFCADISGIQSFIYDIHSRKAAKSIKGRSFYLQLLIDSIIQRIIYEADVCRANVIYSSGGKFFMLLPNTTEILQKIADLEKEITQNLFDEYQGSLYVCMATLPFGYGGKGIICPEKQQDGKNISGLGDLWKTISDKTSRKKQSKFFSLLQDANRFSEFFEGEFNEDYNGQNMAVCAVTGRPTKAIKENEIDNGVYVLQQVKEQTNLGQALKGAEFYETVHFIKGNGFKDWVEPIQLQVFHNLPKSKNQANDYCFQSIINPTEQTDINKIANHYRSAGLMFYGGNEQAEINGEWKTFEELVEPDVNRNFRKLAVVRMDVDNLGVIFNDKMTGVLGSFACYSTLSAMFDLFFSGYLNTIRNSEKYKDFVNVLYSGGDDVCAVGRWDKVIEFTKDVRKKFAEFTGDKGTNITLSAGLVMVNPKFPISKAIDMAADALDKAKKHQTQRQIEDKQKGISDKYDKNNFHLLDETMSWAEEVDFVFGLSEKLQELLQINTISKGFIYKLFAFKSLKDEGKLDWWWQSAYFFAKQAKDKEAQKIFFESIKNALVTGRFEFNALKNNQATKERMLDLICLSAKLADIYSR